MGISTQKALLLVPALLLNTATPLPAVSQEQAPSNFVNAFKQAQNRRLNADRDLIDGMEDVADWLVRYRLKTGHFPEPGEQEDNAISYMQRKYLTPNPYTATPIVSESERKTPCQVRFIHLVGLAEFQRLEWEKKAPADWRADPGTVTIIVNEYNYLVIWGASADRAPVLDSKGQKNYLSWRQVQ